MLNFCTGVSQLFDHDHHDNVSCRMLNCVQVYVSCLRVLCGTEGASSEDTCQTLQQVADVCGDMRYPFGHSNAHMKISELLSRTDCPSSTTAIHTSPVPETEPTDGGIHVI